MSNKSRSYFASVLVNGFTVDYAPCACEFDVDGLKAVAPLCRKLNEAEISSEVVFTKTVENQCYLAYKKGCKALGVPTGSSVNSTVSCIQATFAAQTAEADALLNEVLDTCMAEAVEKVEQAVVPAPEASVEADPEIEDALRTALGV